MIRPLYDIIVVIVFSWVALSFVYPTPYPCEISYEVGGGARVVYEGTCK